MLNNFSIEKLIIMVPVVLIAITFHEFAHGWAAHTLGDPTPKRQGRLTLNPISHLDPLGALLLLVAGFGWAKPVEVNPYYFKGDRRKGMMMVAFAGPLSNIIISFIAALLLAYLPLASGLLRGFLNYLILINIYLASFNLLPVPPLDGSKILAGLVPRNKSDFIYALEGYGPLILMLLIITGATSFLVIPIANLIMNVVWSLTSLFVF
ncbi:MAG: site-2 protease family protein [Bacillota bacterium]